MAKCEVIDLTLSDSNSDGDFIQAKKIKVEAKSLSPRYRYAQLYTNYYSSLAKSGRFICIARSWEFGFAMLTSVRAKRFTSSSGKTSLNLLNVFQGQAAGPTEVGCAV